MAWIPLSGVELVGRRLEVQHADRMARVRLHYVAGATAEAAAAAFAESAAAAVVVAQKSREKQLAEE